MDIPIKTPAESEHEKIQSTLNNHQKISQNILRPTNAIPQNQTPQPQPVVFIVSGNNSDAKKISELEKKLSSKDKELSDKDKEISELKKQLSTEKNSVEVESLKGGKVESVEEVEKISETEKKSLTDDEVTNFTAQLWKNNPVPKDEPEPTKDVVKNSYTVGKFQVIAARVRGKKHKHEGTNCDDWFETEEVEGMIFSAVSDGAGSKKFSRIGSRISCQTAIKFLETELPKILKQNPDFKKNLGSDTASKNFSNAAGNLANILHQSILKAREAVVEKFEEVKNLPEYKKVVGRVLELGDFAATFILSAIIPVADDKTLVMACQVGDGMIIAFDADKNFLKLCDADSGTFAGETDFLTNTRRIENLQKKTQVSLRNFDLILSMTDGVADDYEGNEQKLFDDLLANKILSNESPADKLAKWLETYTVRGSFDDRTLVVIQKCGAKNG